MITYTETRQRQSGRMPSNRHGLCRRESEPRQRWATPDPQAVWRSTRQRRVPGGTLETIDAGPGTKPQGLPDQATAPETITSATEKVHLFYTFPAIDMAECNRLGLIITRIDANDTLSPKQIVVLHPDAGGGDAPSRMGLRLSDGRGSRRSKPDRRSALSLCRRLPRVRAVASGKQFRHHTPHCLGAISPLRTIGCSDRSRPRHAGKPEHRALRAAPRLAEAHPRPHLAPSARRCPSPRPARLHHVPQRLARVHPPPASRRRLHASPGSR